MRAVEWLLKREIQVLATDLPTIDDARLIQPDQPLPMHVRILESGIPIVECLTNLQSLPANEFILSAFPLKLVGADGGPCRAVGIVE